MDYPSLSECKKDLAEIINRTVIDEDRKKELLDILYARKDVLPLRGILVRLDEIKTLPLTGDEITKLDEIKFIYI